MEKKLFRTPRLILGAVILLFAGIIYAWTNLRGAFKDFGWTETQLLICYGITVSFFCIGSLISGILAKKVSILIRMAVSAALITGGYCISASLTADRLWLLFIAYGFMIGTGIGFVYNIVIASTSAWFPDKKGVASGVLMMGFGFSSLVVGLVSKSLFEAVGWQKTFLLFGFVIGAVVLIGGFLVKTPPEGTVLPAPAAPKNKKTAVIEARDYAPSEMLKRGSFWKLFIFFILFAAVGSTAIPSAKQCAESLGVVDGLVVIIGSVVAVFNGVGRICAGLVFDKLGLRKTQFITSGVVIAATVITLVGVIMRQPVIGTAGLFLCGFSFGFSPTVSAAFTMAFYGMKNYGVNLSLLNLILIPAAFIPTLASVFMNATGGSYIPVFALLAGFSVIGLGINFSIKKA